MTVAKPELGTKRIDPETGRKFYDLNREPIVSPYTGKSYPLSFFEESSVAKVLEKEEEEDVKEVDAESTEVELVSLEDADDEASGGDDLPDLGDDEVEIDGDDDDTFLEADDEDDDDDMSDLIGVSDEDEDV
ncbi:TIGR02300 family protein [Sinorhizobium fredii]|nr:TIGR02300 family protein [Sinorhizobium fredii]GEC32712.1 TIGR02300 family protein [Sinorhizobium fredii]GLS12409.1 TIGR02300 family protein [Sinorhizobium fredii]